MYIKITCIQLINTLLNSCLVLHTFYKMDMIISWLTFLLLQCIILHTWLKIIIFIGMLMGYA